MNRKFLTVILLCAVIALLSSIVLVNASPLTIRVSPTSGSFGTNVEVQGSDCTPDGEVRIYFGTLIRFFAARAIANSTGGFYVNLSVPTFPAGTYNILAKDMITGDVNSAPFTIKPMITLASDEVSCADEVTVKGYGFRNGVPLTIEFDGIDVTPWPRPQTDGFGSFEAKFHVPSVPEGRHYVNVSEGTFHSSASVRVIPKITLNPTSGPVSTVVFVNGTGFSPFSRVSVLMGLEPINVTMYPTFQTASDGSFQHIFLVPDLSDGKHNVNATDETGNSATAQFLIPSPTLTLEPSEIFGSSIVTVQGEGFPPSQPVLLYLEANMVIDFVDLMVGSEKIYADEYGAYRYSFIAPVTRPGVYEVVAYKVADYGFTAGEALASASLKIVEDALLKEIKDDIATIIVPDLGIIKENLTSIDAKLVNLEGEIATINSTLGLIYTDLTSIDAKLVNLKGEIATINSTLGLIYTDISNLRINITNIEGKFVTIQTSLGDIQGIIESIEGDTATIETEIGTVVGDISHVKGKQESSTILMYLGLTLALIAGVGTIYLTIIHVQVMRRPVED